jgi:uncharacterized DUF497 family protein
MMAAIQRLILHLVTPYYKLMLRIWELNLHCRSEGNIAGEERLQTLGMVSEVLFVVYTERGENKRLISPAAQTRR